MKEYKEVSKIIKAYVSAVYGQDKRDAKNKNEAREFLTDLMDILKKHKIVVDYAIEFKDKYEGVDLIPIALYYTISDDKTILLDLLL